MIWPLGQSGPGALGSGEDSPTSSTPGWAQGARKLDLMPGYIMCAERAAGVGRAGRWEPCVPGLAEQARLPGTVVRCGPRSPPCPPEAGGGRPGLPERGCWTVATSGHPLSTDTECGVGVGAAGRTPSQSRTAPLRAPRPPRPVGSRLPHWVQIALPLWDRGQLPAAGWLRCPPRRDITLFPKSQLFPPGRSGSWKDRGGIPRRV